MPGKRSNFMCLAALVACQAVVAAGEPPRDLRDDQAFVSFAAGAIEFVYPADWRASELARGRDLLLVLSPGEPPQQPRALRQGVWFAYRVVPSDLATDARWLANKLAAALRRDLPKAVVESVQQAKVAGFRAAELAFTLPGAEPLFAAPGEQQPRSTTALQGRRWLVRTSDAVVEIHSIAPTDQLADHDQAASRLLASLAIRPPQLGTPEVLPGLLDAERIVGSWKSPRALLEIRGDGHLALRYDNERNYELGKLGAVDYSSPIRELSGRFTAERDLLRIRWADGSLLNFRWRLARGELLITDHHGRTRRLSRLVR